MKPIHDVVIVGAGPSGSTAANLLASAGADVLLLEREVFPRFHIGESLLPCDLEVFDRLGVSLEGQPDHLHKAGAEFYEEAAGRHAIYPFADALGGTRDHAFQVERASFDLALLEAAARAGARVQAPEWVREVDLDRDGEVEVRTDRGVYRARYLIDATGQDSFLARRHRSRRRIDDFGLAAAFRHYGDLRPDVAAELASTGNIKVFFVDGGWLWAIPLGGGSGGGSGCGRLSVGLVSRDKGIRDDWLDARIEASPELRRMLEGARPEGPHRRIGAFSFHNERPHGPRWVCVGDAACFLDPVFSSGVSFGMLGAAHAADTLLPALDEKAEAAPGLMDAHAAHMTEAYDVFATLILSLYQRRLLPGLFFSRDQDAQLRRGLTSVLAGDVWRDDNPFQQQLMASERRRFRLPLHRGGPEVAEAAGR